MTGSQSPTLPPGRFHLLKEAFEHATKGLAKDEGVPAVKACLADKLLALVSSRECDPAQLGDVALAKMRACLLDCTGCRVAKGGRDRVASK